MPASYTIASFGKSLLALQQGKRPTLRRTLRLFRAAQQRWPKGHYRPYISFTNGHLGFGLTYYSQLGLAAAMWGYGHDGYSQPGALAKLRYAFFTPKDYRNEIELLGLNEPTSGWRFWATWASCAASALLAFPGR